MMVDIILAYALPTTAIWCWRGAPSARACVKACPEGDVIWMIDGKATLIEPSQCIGHGACRVACPFGAVTLVFGTERRGIDIPRVKPTFETTFPVFSSPESLAVRGHP
jgi:Fe-S-cluster-containing hydrogenase component 2